MSAEPSGVGGLGLGLRGLLRPLRVRLTVTFAVVIGIVLVVAGVLVFDQFRRSYDAQVDAELVERQAAVVREAADARSPGELLAEAGESLAQVYAPTGRLLASTAGLRDAGPLLDPEQVRAAADSPLMLTVRSASGLGDDGARLRAFPIDGGAAVAVLGEGRATREVALHRLAIILALVLPGALVLASVAGYRVARAALDPVERMRARAAAIDAADPADRLPRPETNDELDRLAVTLNDLLDRLADALERERRIVGDASHELRTPISVLRTRVDVALRRPDATAAELRDALAEASSDAARLGSLADDLLVLARADQGQLAMRRELIEALTLVEDAAARHAPRAAQEGRAIEVRDGVDGGAVVLGDPARLAQVLDNLVANALHHGEGTVTLGTAAGDAGTVLLTVDDQGPGMPAGFEDRAFERFSQAAPGADGSGLGLSLVQALVEAHAGTVGVEDLAPGFRVRVALPPA